LVIILYDFRGLEKTDSNWGTASYQDLVMILYHFRALKNADSNWESASCTTCLTHSKEQKMFDMELAKMQQFF
jgi:hypothetical protein